ncbi:MAG: aminotransferase class V-fold PLP-dependent enzyme [Ezakiella sp.]|nr:aminotransferase class V-fold PLP-dependent enzyme [Ezakiella sp.]
MMDFYSKNNISKSIINEIEASEEKLVKEFQEIRKIVFYNQQKVLSAMQDEHLNSGDFFWPTGYGYGDVGRDKVEKIYSRVFNTEDALVRPSIASGTHAIFLALNSLLQYGDELIYISDIPYDTMQKSLGFVGNEKNNLKSKGVKVDYVPLNKNNLFDFEAIKKCVTNDTKVVAIQRSTGYSLRRAFTIDEIKEVIGFVKAINKNIIVFVDNCYGEFTETLEPSDVGADIVAGSLIKNPGAGIAFSGGYLVGTTDLIDMCANTLTAPGIGKEVGLTFGTTRFTLQGLFLAPHVVGEAMKAAHLIGLTLKERGYEVIPDVGEARSDIVQTIIFKVPEVLKQFTIGVQQAGAVDSYAIPTAWDMPGYEDQVIMASPGFVEGSSIEISCDAPMREPFAAYYQGGITYEHAKIALMFGLRNIDR